MCDVVTSNAHNARPYSISDLLARPRRRRNSFPNITILTSPIFAWSDPPPSNVQQTSFAGGPLFEGESFRNAGKCLDHRMINLTGLVCFKIAIDLQLFVIQKQCESFDISGAIDKSRFVNVPPAFASQLSTRRPYGRVVGLKGAIP